MKLYMPKNTFRWGETMALQDKAGRTRYTVAGEAYSLGKRLHVHDLAGREAVYVYQRVPSLFPCYAIEVYGKPVGEITKDLTFFRPRYTMKSLNWEIAGTLGACDYEITRQSTVVASSRPQQDVHALTFYDRVTELTALGVVLAINCVLAPQEPKHL